MIWVGFELTKKFEKKLRGRCREIYENLTDPKILRPSHLKGEVTIVIGPYTA
jgi:16S rRNA C1402 (ribose-2'-O) methylase RsmI